VDRLVIGAGLPCKSDISGRDQSPGAGPGAL
jgi:hypothetical protein